MIKRGCQTANRTWTVSHTGSGGEVMTTYIAQKVLQNLSVGTPLREISWFSPCTSEVYRRESFTRCSHDNKLFRMCKVHFILETGFLQKGPQPRIGETFSHFSFMTIASSSVHWIKAMEVKPFHQSQKCIL